MNYSDIKVGDTVYYYRMERYRPLSSMTMGESVVTEITKKFIITSGSKYLLENGCFPNNSCYCGRIFISENERNQYIEMMKLREKISSIPGHRISEIQDDDLKIIANILEKHKII